ncbi:MAG: lytic transglycosylase domain-containing protein [Rhodomicrobium sp.]|jgi:soluble lytic murein transglycosylase-like protein
MGALLPIAAAVLFIFSAVLPAAAEIDLCEREMAWAANKYAIPLGILYAVGLTETGVGGHLHAYALNLEGDTVYSLSKEQAILRFHAAQAAGRRLIDVGCMQLNYHFHGQSFSSVGEMLDPHKNVDYAARFLKELKAREGGWTLAVARYNAGKNNDPAQKRYVCKVLARLAESGFGAWTPRSSAFCESERAEPKASTAKPTGWRTTSLVQVR